MNGDILARPILAFDDAELRLEQFTARLRAGELDGAERALRQAEMKMRAGKAILEARLARVEE